MGGFDFAMGQIIVLLTLQRRYLGISQQDALFGCLFLQRGQALLERGQVVAQPDGANAGRRNEDASLAKFVAGSDLAVGGLLPGALALF